ncbi:MAG TPA: hypothetical protein VJ996_04280, partial [Solirubrobacteraceae bacterium]|nr:hypothetical protein [Solirubrobacteraceae bacterium]
GCPPETLELLGFPWTFEMTTKGVGELIGHRKLGIVLPGPCVYEARTIAGDFELEAFSEIDAGAVLGRNAHRSLATCASSLEMSIAFWPFNNSEGLVDAELRG